MALRVLLMPPLFQKDQLLEQQPHEQDRRSDRIGEIHEYCGYLFFVMRKGLGVAYPAVNAKPVIQKLLKEGFSAGVHGMAYNDEKTMQEEFDTFKSISGLIVSASACIISAMMKAPGINWPQQVMHLIVLIMKLQILTG